MDDTNPKDLIGSKKPDVSLVPPAAVIYEALAMENGAAKYGPYNWREKKVRARVYIAAAMRHLMSYLDGEELASDSNVHHLGHARACLGILVDAIETGNLIDDRPPSGTASGLIDFLAIQRSRCDVPATLPIQAGPTTQDSGVGKISPRPLIL